MIKDIIFDMDVVIVYSEPLWEKVFKQYLERIGITFLNDNDLTKIHNEQLLGKNWTEISKILKTKFHISGSCKKIVDDCMAEAIRIFNRELKIVPGAKTLIKLLYSHKYPLALASSTPHKVINYIINRYNLKKYFKVVISGVEVTQGKPHPAIFLKTAKKLKVKPKHCLVIEDSPSGAKAAKRSGMKCIVLKQPYTVYKHLKMADLVIKSLKDINLKTIKNL